MCYTGVCLFENGGDRAGECMVFRHKEFESRYGESPCIVGQCPQDPDEEKYMQENKEHLDDIHRRWCRERGA